MPASVSNPSIAGSEGANQGGRFLAALDPSTAPLDGRSAADLCEIARALGDGISFWSGEDSLWPNISWASFLPEFTDSTLAAAEARAAGSPQAALFLAFLRLYGLAQVDLNNLTNRHLRFHYRKVLGLLPKGPTPDRVNLVLGLKKGTTEVRIPQGAEFTTGDGLRYATEHEIFAHPSEVIHQRVMARTDDDQIVYAAAAASLGGLGVALPDDDQSWHPFGEGNGFPAAQLGFAISSTALVLKEGTRTVTIHLELKVGTKKLDEAVLRKSFTAYFSGEEEWIEAQVPTEPAVKVASTKTAGVVKVSIPFTLDSEAGAVLPYDPTVLEGGFDTLAPVMKVLLAEEEESADEGGEDVDAEEVGKSSESLATTLAGLEVVSVSLEVAADGMKDLVLENDFGRLDPSKAFLPFGPQPRAGSSFYIGAEEALTKEIVSAKLKLQWNSPAAKFEDYYAGYTARDGTTKLVSGNSDFKACLEVLRKGKFVSLGGDKDLFRSDATLEQEIDSTQQDDKVLSFKGIGYTRFAAQFSRVVPSARLRLPFTNHITSRPLTAVPATPVLAFRSELRLPTFKLAGSRLRSNTRNGFLRLRLRQGFHHDRYPELFAKAFAEGGDKTPPNAPYTPELASFSLDYAAKSRTSSPNKESDVNFADRDLRFFHLTPFGQREEHVIIKNDLDAESKRVFLLPGVKNAGELYLGLSGLEPLQTISLLFQVLEGSANPLSETPTVTWSVLCSNHWKELETSSVLAESTDNLLTSGVVRLLLPEETTLDNTVLEPGLAWIRAAIADDRSAVAKLIAIRPNAVPATLQNPKDATHLGTGLPEGSVAAAASTVRGLKTIEQPYSSSGGADAESTRSFHTRTSERLRHRGVAVTPWDYERLILNEFRQLYLVRCLPHTEVIRDLEDTNKTALQSSPGHVTIVVIPDTRGRNVLNPLQPFVDTATIAGVEKFIAGLHTPFATIHVTNPVYEEVELMFRVAFRTGLPFSSYQPILQADLKLHISPWASEDSLLPDFGGSIVRSSMISFIESLEYIDYLKDFQLEPTVASAAPGELQEVSASRPDAILTSVPSHTIKAVSTP